MKYLMSGNKMIAFWTSNTYGNDAFFWQYTSPSDAPPHTADNSSIAKSSGCSVRCVKDVDVPKLIVKTIPKTTAKAKTKTKKNS